MNPLESLRKLMARLDGWQRRARWAGVPYAVVNILMAVILFSVLCGPRRTGGTR